MIRIVAAVVAIGMILALAPFPYGYYMLLRVVTFAGGIYCGYLLLDRNRPLAVALFICAAVFNPIVPVHLLRGVWAFLNLGGAALFGYVAYTSDRKQQSE